METVELQVHQALLVQLALKDLQVLLGSLELQVYLGPQELQVAQEIQVLLGLMVLLDHLASMEIQEHQEQLAHQDKMEQVGHRVCKVSLDFQDPKEEWVQQASQVQLAQQEFQGLLGHQGHPVNLVLMAILEQQV